LACTAVLAAAVLLPGAASGGGCPPIECALSETPIAHGSLLAFRPQGGAPLRVVDLVTGRTRWRLPPGVLGGHRLVHQDGALLTWFDAATGARTGDAVLQRHGAFALVGAAQDGRRAVLARTQTRSTTFAIVSPAAERTVILGGNTWTFDALDGTRLYLIHAVAAGYDIRVVDLATGALRPRPIGERLHGVAWQRVASTDGRYVFTLYLGTHGSAMVHVLDVRRATARCVDLPGAGNANAAVTYGLLADVDPRQAWAVSPGYGRVALIDATAGRIGSQYRFDAGRWNTVPVQAALAPDGDHIAFADGSHVWVSEPATHQVARLAAHTAIAIGWSPDQRKLWVVGQRSRVSWLRPRW
jgi:hypothetical protein